MYYYTAENNVFASPVPRQTTAVTETRDNRQPIGRENESQSDVTTFSSVTEIVEVVPSTLTQYYAKISNPFPDQTIAILSRPYNLPVIQWSTTTTNPGTKLAEYYFPCTLLNATNFSELLSRFRFMRADLVLKFQMASMSMFYGALMISHVPAHFIIGGNDPYMTNVYGQSVNRAQILSAAPGSAVEFRIPWTCPLEYFDVVKAIDNTDGHPNHPDGCFIAKVIVSVLAPLRTSASTTTTTVEVRCTAHFENIEIAGYHGVENQSSSEVVKKSRDLATTGVPSAGKFSSILESAESMAPLADLITGLLDKPTMERAADPCDFRIMSDTQHGKGLDRSLKVSFEPSAQLSTEGVNMGVATTQPSVKDVIGSPMLIKLTSFDQTASAGAMVMRMPLDPSYIPIYASSENEHYLQASPLAHVARGFRFWRGSLKILIKFFASVFTKANLMISYVPKFTTQPDVANQGDYVSAQVEVEGDVDYAFTVPYLRQQVWSPVLPYFSDYGTGYDLDAMPLKWFGNYSFVPDLCVNVLNKLSVQDPGVTSRVYMAVFLAAGEDFEFSNLVRPSLFALSDYTLEYVPYQPPESKKRKGNKVEVVENQSLATAFSVPFKGLVTPSRQTRERKFVAPETYVNYIDLIKRYSLTGLTGADIVSRVTGIVDWSPQEPNRVIEHWVCLFKFFRGGLRWKVPIQHDGVTYYGTTNQEPPVETSFGTYPNTNNDIASAWAQTATYQLDPYNGAYFFLPYLQSVIEVEMPWYTAYPFLETYNTLFPEDDVCTEELTMTSDQITNNTAQQSYVAVPDDFGLAIMVAPPALVAKPAESKKQKFKLPSLTRESKAQPPAKSFFFARNH